MGKESKIQWTDATWNIARGCDKVDSDCKYCYMFRDSLSGTRYVPNTVIRTKTRFNLPLTLKEPSKIFTCSLTDFFHPEIDSYREEAWAVIRKCPQHTFQILTKRPERIIGCLPADWGEGYKNVWLGTSVGSQKAANTRIPALLRAPGLIKFLSIEPLHERINLFDPELRDTLWFMNYSEFGQDADIEGDLHWVIIGGESGNDNGKYKYRPCELEWMEDLVAECLHADIAVFVKQMGTHLAKKLKMSDRHGTNIEEFPASLRYREFPDVKQFI